MPWAAKSVFGLGINRCIAHVDCKLSALISECAFCKISKHRGIIAFYIPKLSAEFCIQSKDDIACRLRSIALRKRKSRAFCSA